jgi:predicted dehydrogenase
MKTNHGTAPGVEIFLTIIHSKMKRRAFISTTAQAGFLAGSVPLFKFGSVDRKFRVALIGTGWWGMNILQTAISYGRCKVVGLCDVDQNQLVQARTKLSPLSTDHPKTYTDYRELLRKEKPDITIVATADHWHALPAIAALKAGSHVYLEKPIGHTIGEGLALVAAQDKYGGKIQVGLHRHAAPHNIAGMDFLRSGAVGDIKLVKAFVNYTTASVKNTPDSEPPEGLDWDFWIGPAPYRSFNPAIHPRGFRNFLDFANGTCADWGVHWFDQILWWSEEKHPRRVHSIGGQVHEGQVYDAPDYQLVTFEFEQFTAQWEHRRLSGYRTDKHNIGVYFYGTKGIFHMGWLDGWTFYPNDKHKDVMHMDHTLHDPDKQNIPELWADFIESIDKDRKPAADIVNSHYATNMSLLAMISQKVGRPVQWDGQKQQINGDAAASKLITRPYRAPWEYPTPESI